MELLTHTKRRDFTNCHRYFFHRHVQHLTPRLQRGGRRRGAAFGEAIFTVGEVHRRYAESTDHSEEFPLVDIIRDSVFRSYNEVFPGSQEEQDKIDLEQVKVRVMARYYVEKYGIDLRRELQFDMPLRNPHTGYTSRAFRLAGKIDGLQRTGRPKHARIIEDKFVGQIQQAMIDRLPLDAQTSEYVDAIIAQGWTAEVVYRHTRNPQSEPKLIGTKATGGRRRESLDEYAVRLADDVADRPEHYFDEQIVFFPDRHLDDYRKGRWGTAQQILEARRTARRQGFETAYPMNPSRCWEYGGCEFIPLCTKRDGAEDLYITVPDNPELTGKDEDGANTEYPAGASY